MAAMFTAATTATRWWSGRRSGRPTAVQWYGIAAGDADLAAGERIGDLVVYRSTAAPTAVGPVRRWMG